MKTKCRLLSTMASKESFLSMLLFYISLNNSPKTVEVQMSANFPFLKFIHHILWTLPLTFEILSLNTQAMPVILPYMSFKVYDIFTDTFCFISRYHDRSIFYMYLLFWHFFLTVKIHLAKASLVGYAYMSPVSTYRYFFGDLKMMRCRFIFSNSPRWLIISYFQHITLLPTP